MENINREVKIMLAGKARVVFGELVRLAMLEQVTGHILLRYTAPPLDADSKN